MANVLMQIHPDDAFGEQRIFFLKKIQTLPSASQRALGKEIKKKFKLCRVPARGHSAKKFF